MKSTYPYIINNGEHVQYHGTAKSTIVMALGDAQLKLLGWGKPIGGGRAGVWAGRVINILPPNDHSHNTTKKCGCILASPGLSGPLLSPLK